MKPGLRYGGGATSYMTLTVFLIGLVASRATAQEALTLDATAGDSIIARFNAAATVRMFGDAAMPAGVVVDGDVAVLAGTLDLAGHVRGTVVVINGVLQLRAGAVVDGDVIVTGGTIQGLADARIGGSTRLYPEALRYHREADRITAVGERIAGQVSAGREFRYGRSELRAAVEGSYNRVEGLPIGLGGRLVLGRGNPTQLSARLIYRTASGLRLDPDELGYHVGLAQSIGGARGARFTAALRSEITPIETEGLTGREASLATFLLHRDYRDHFERVGWSIGLGLAPRSWATRLAAEYRDERHDRVAPESPWSVFDNNEPWRPQPAAAAGRLRTIALRYGFDSRNEEVMPSSGWLVDLELERALDVDLELPTTTAEGPFAQRPALQTFTAATLDMRRYARLGRRSRLATRVWAAGALSDGPLPPQRQHALGGEGTLPAYPLFGFSCGARRAAILLDEVPFFPHYGCDRAVLVQLEHDATLPLGDVLRGAFGGNVDLSDAAGWIVFFDAGRAWSEDAVGDGRTRGQGDFAAEAGLGVRLGRLGAYWAFPLTGGGETANFFIRLDRRF
ncbi:MAG: hypothetical protein ACRELD_05545 [Longimicrobiales bacterium]